MSLENRDQRRCYQNIDALIQLLLDRLGKSKIISIGDSHSRLFANLQSVITYPIGPVTAFNLVKENSSTNGREKLFYILDAYSSTENAILLSFGEIDIRAHVIKACIKNRISVRESAIRIAIKYSTVISQIVGRGFSVLVQGVHASGSFYNNQSFPTVGRVEDRNYAIKQFNGYLRNFCISLSIPYASLDSLVIDANLKTKNEYMRDGCHIDASPEILAILIYQFLASPSLSRNNYDHLKVPHEIFDVARGKPYILTSSYHWKCEGIVSRRDPYFFHTDLGLNQGILIDLQAKFLIDSIRIVNRVGSCQDRAKLISVILFDLNDEIFRVDVNDNKLFLSSGGAIQIKISNNISASRVKILSRASIYLHLSEINVFSCLPPFE